MTEIQLLHEERLLRGTDAARRGRSAVLRPDGTLDLSKGVLDLDRVEEVFATVFTEHARPRLGGASGVRGWSSVAALQRCAYAWKLSHKDGVRPVAPDLEIGSTVHTYLAVHYQRQIEPSYPITPEALHARLLDSGCAPSMILKIWDYWQRYKLEYDRDYLRPLAVEQLAVDPDGDMSCRYDLIARIDDPEAHVTAGTYVVEHKTSGLFNEQTLYGWRGNGEIQGQILLWDRAGMRERFGPLAGVMVNVIGKQKQPRFHRFTVVPSEADKAQHLSDLRYFRAYLDALRQADTWPRSRANCYSNGGKCAHWNHCLGDDLGDLRRRIVAEPAQDEP